MTIRPRTNPSGKIVFQLDLGEGKGARKSYPTKKLAQAALDREEERRAYMGKMADDIAPEELAEMITARNRLRTVGATISQATDFFLTHGKRLLEPLLIPDLVERFRKSRQEKNLSTDYVDQLGTSLSGAGGLATRYPLTWTHELTSKQVETWNKNPQWGAKTRNNYLGDVSAMYEWALLPTQGHARINPCVGVERDPKKRKGRKPSLDVAQCEQMLQAAVEQKRWRVLTFLVVSLFGGLRPEAEAADQKLQWEDVNLDEGHIRLTEEVVKTGPGRVVDLTPQAVAWLRLVPEELRKGPLVPATNWAEEWTRFRHFLGWRVASEKVAKKRCLPAVEPVHGEWPKDVLRHTFASYHYAHHQNEALLQVQMGHTSAKMLHEHYRAVRTRQEAALFWALAPAAAS